MSENATPSAILNGAAIKQTIKGLIATDLDVNIELEEIGDDVSLLDKGLALDSVVIVELINLLEERFDFHFSDEDMNTELFESLSALADFVARKTSDLPSAEGA